MPQNPKPIQKTQVINLAAKMDNRGNSEVVNISPNENGIAFSYLENANLYYSKALRNRNGTQDLCGGVVNFTFDGTNIVNVPYSGIGYSGCVQIFDDIPQLNATFDYPTTLFIPNSNMALCSGSVYITEIETPANYTALGSQVNYDLDLKGYLFKVDQIPYPASGVSWMSGNTILGATADLHDISFAGNYNVGGTASYPEYESQTTPVPSGSKPVAVCDARFNLGAVTLISGSYRSADTEVGWKFNSPAYISSGSVYAIRWTYQLTSGTATRSINLNTLGQPSGIDYSPDSRRISEFYYIGAPANQTYALREFEVGATKSNVIGTIYKYNTPLFLAPDYYTSDLNAPFPAVSGTYTNSTNPTIITYGGAVEAADIGQVITLSGTHNPYGSYFWAGANNNSKNLALLNGSDNSTLSGQKNVGITTSLYKIDAFTGTMVGGDYSITSKTLLAAGSGTHVFDFDGGNNLRQGYLGDSYKQADYRMDKIYTLFSNPPAITASGESYLITFGLYDLVTGGPYNDYATARSPVGSLSFFPSALSYGLETQTPPNYSGVAVLDYSGNGVFTQFSGSYPGTVNGSFDNTMNIQAQFDLTCGLIDVPSGNAVVGITDYRVGGDRSSEIVYGQGGEVRYFDLDTPNKSTHTTIFSGISTLNNSLMSFAVYDDLLFMTDYSQISGICWDQTNSGTMTHGLRPTAITTAINGTGGTIPSGQAFSLMIAADMSSGGIRTTIIPFPSGITQNFLEVSGLSNQYAFDVPVANMTTYITAASGSNYYLAQAYSGNSTSSTLMTYPYPSGTDVVYISRLADVNLDDTFADITTYPQNYALAQTDTPKMKYISVFYDYILGLGDPLNTSRLWYSEQYAPQIWGESFNFHGFVDVDKDNGSPLTGMARLRDYMMLFKKNSTYRVEFLGNTSEPFSITQVSSKIGSIGAFGLVTVGDTVYGLCEYGIFATNGATVQIISDVIDPFFADMDHGDLTFATAIHNMHEDKIIWSISNDNLSPDRDIGIVFNYKEGAFSIRKGSSWNAGATVYDDDGFDVLLGGTTMGQIQVVDSNTPNSTSQDDEEVFFVDGQGYSANRSVQLVAETPWLSILDSNLKKQFRFIDFNVERSDSLLRVDVYFDEDDTNLRYTRYVNLNTNNPDKRVNLGGKAKTVKFVFTNVGEPALIKIKALNIYYVILGLYDEI